MSDSKLRLEDLSNDIFMEIFDYFYGQHIVFTFSQLNSRFNSLCAHYSNYHIDATDYHTFVNNRKLNHLLHLIYSKHIRSLKFCEERWIRRISAKYLVSLCSLTFIKIKNLTEIKQFLEKLPSPHHIHHLSITINLRKVDIQDIVTTISNLPNLTRLEWDSYCTKLNFDSINQSLLSLRHLLIRCYECYDFLKLVASMPNLISLNLLCRYDYSYIDSTYVRPNSLSKLKSLQLDNVADCEYISYIFQLCPQLEIFKVQCHSKYSPYLMVQAESWEQLLSPMKFLQKVDITIGNIFKSSVVNLLEYETDFWIERNLKAIVYDDSKPCLKTFSIKSD